MPSFAYAPAPMRSRLLGLGTAGQVAGRTLARASLVFGMLFGFLYLVSPGRLFRYVSDPRRTDFALYYREAAIGVRFGWAHVYDLDLFQRVGREVGVISRDSPQLQSLGLPLLDWIVAPLTLLPLGPAFAIWLVLMAGALTATFWLLAPKDHRRLHGLLFALYPPAILTLALGQAVALVALGLAAGVVLLRGGRQWAAGIAFALMMLKPQLALLVPACLLAAGYWRPVCTAALAGLLVLVGALLLTGAGPIHDLLLRLLTATQHPGTWEVATDIAPAAALSGQARLGFQLAVAFVALLAARRGRAQGRPEPAVAAGVVGSLLIAPYLHFQDLVLLFPVAWMLIAEGLASWERRYLEIAYLQAMLGLSILPIMTGAWLALSAVRTVRERTTGAGTYLVKRHSDAPSAPRA